ncbi:MAG: hypothetical protein GY711_11485 [bacterium]|nr:hypothetical protein [bacterium]
MVRQIEIAMTKKRRKKPVNRAERIRPHIVQKILADFPQDDRLERTDVICLTIHALERASERRILPYGPIHGRHLTRCVILAVDGVVRAMGLPRSALVKTASGITYRTPQARLWHRAMRAWCRTFTAWCKEMDDIAGAFCEQRDLDPRQEALFEHWWTQRQDLGLPRLWEQFGRAARRVNGVLGLPDDPGDRKQLLHLFRALTEGTPGGIFRGDDDRLRIGQRQLRDAVSSELGVSRSRRKMPRSVELEHDVPDDDAEDVRQALEAVEAIRGLRDAIAARKREVEPDSARWYVLDDFEPLLTGDMTFRELEAKVGKAKSALQRAFQAEREAVLTAAGFPEK